MRQRIALLTGLFLMLPFGGIARADEGISANAGLKVIDWKEAGKHVGQMVIVQGKVVEARNIGTICFLNFDAARSFTAVVREGNFKKFPKAPEQLYKGRIVRIRGVISQFKNKPEIEFQTPDDIQVLDKAEPIASQPASRPARKFDGTLTVATYNVLNLFDSYDDPYHEDEGTPAKPMEQLKALAASIRDLDADVLAVEEVENRDYLERFTRSMLGDMGYREVVGVESNDQRGIECGILSRFPIGPVTTHRFVDFDDGKGGRMRFRRDLLQVRIEPPGFESFDVFVVHLKSKRGGESTDTERLAEARAIRAIFDQILTADPKARFLICGDFNDTWESDSLKTIRGDGPMGLTSFMADLPPKSKSFNGPDHPEVIDYILCSPTLGGRYLQKSYRIIPGSVKTTGSDHNPVVATLKLESSR